MSPFVSVSESSKVCLLMHVCVFEPMHYCVCVCVFMCRWVHAFLAQWSIRSFFSPLYVSTYHQDGMKIWKISFCHFWVHCVHFFLFITRCARSISDTYTGLGPLLYTMGGRTLFYVFASILLCRWESFGTFFLFYDALSKAGRLWVELCCQVLIRGLHGCFQLFITNMSQAEAELYPV